MSIQLSVIIPFKNEAQRIPETIKTVLDYFNKHNLTFELILVDDGSTDDSVKIINHLFPAITNIRILNHPVNRGKGAAIQTGVFASRGDCILFIDADLSTPITEYEKLNNAITTADIAIGSRKNRALLGRRQAWYRELPGRLGNFLIRLTLDLPWQDTQCGFKLFRAPVAKKLFSQLRLPRWSFDFEILARAQQQKISVSEVPVIWNNKAGSTFRPLIDHLRSFFDLIWLRFHL